MAKKEDQRIVKTKDKLAAALIELLKVRPMAEIKISELCDSANVSRATFYNNFDSVEEVFNFYISSFEIPHEMVVTNNIGSANPGDLSEMFKSYIFPVVAELEKKREELKDVLAVQFNSGEFYLTILNMIKNLCARLLVGYGSVMDVGVPDDVAIAYSSGSIASLIIHLLQVGDKYTLEEKQHFVYHLVFEMDNFYYSHHKEFENKD